MLGPTPVAIDRARADADSDLGEFYHFGHGKPWQWLLTNDSGKMERDRPTMAVNQANKGEKANVRYSRIMCKNKSGDGIMCMRSTGVPIKVGDFLNVQYYGGSDGKDTKVARHAAKWASQKKEIAAIMVTKLKSKNNWLTASVCKKCLGMLPRQRANKRSNIAHNVECSIKRLKMENSAGKPTKKSEAMTPDGWMSEL